MNSWKPIHREAARRVLTFANHRAELADVLRAMHTAGLKIQLIEDPNADGTRTPVETVDPFTFFAAFNRGISDANRQEMWTWLKAHWQLASPVPDEFNLPLVDNRGCWFFPYAPMRTDAHLDALWALAAAAVDQPLSAIDEALFDRCVQLPTIKLTKLSMGLFWLNPDEYLSLDKNTRDYLSAHHDIKVGPERFAGYRGVIQRVREKVGGDFIEISRRAYAETKQPLTTPSFALSPAQMEMLWARFHARIAGFVNFANPGGLEEEELAYKRNALALHRRAATRETARRRECRPCARVSQTPRSNPHHQPRGLPGMGSPFWDGGEKLRGRTHRTARGHGPALRRTGDP